MTEPVVKPVVKPESSAVPAYTETYVALVFYFSFSFGKNSVLVKANGKHAKYHSTNEGAGEHNATEPQSHSQAFSRTALE